jgi:hypothetical protein
VFGATCLSFEEEIMAPLINGITIDGSLIKDTLSGVGGFFKDIRSAITGKIDPEKEAAINMQMAELETKVDSAQTDINKIEAASSSVFVAGWRPYIGWICGTALGVYYIPQALIGAVLWLIQCISVMYAAPDISKVTLPAYPVVFDVAQIIGLVLSLLGMGAIRMSEKIKGVAR